VDGDTDGKINVVATSLIEKLYGSCISVKVDAVKGGGGDSLNNYIDGRWRQTWVDRVTHVNFVGGSSTRWYWLANGRREWARQDAIIRMTYARMPTARFASTANSRSTTASPGRPISILPPGAK
jgi:hypothetical protein